jgi:YHS domain-containing protein
MLALVIGLVTGTASAQARRPEYNVDAAGVALQGYDPVAYFTDGRATKGQKVFTATHDSVTYRFASAAHKREFRAQPARFLPQYGGYRAMGVALGKKLPVDPEAFRVVAGKLYLNVNKSVQRDWLKDVPGHIATADAAWPALRTIAAS